jgi:hypothetical protein
METALSWFSRSNLVEFSGEGFVTLDSHSILARVVGSREKVSSLRPRAAGFGDLDD